MIYSKRNTLNRIAVDKVRGNLIKRITEVQEEQKREEIRQNQEKKKPKIILDDFEEFEEK